MADDLSTDTVAPRGLDFIQGRAGDFQRGGSVAASSATASATGVVGSSIELSGHGTLRLDLVVSAVTGTTPSMTITIQTSFDNGVTDSWRTVAAFPAVTAAGTTRQVFAGIDRWVRANVTTLSGTTPTETFTLSGEAV